VNTTAINAASDATAPQTTGQERDDKMGQDAFLQLLTTQLAHQDPLEPVADTEFLAQLAQFSSLEQLTQISAQIQELSRLIAAQSTNSSTSTATDSTTNGGQ